MPVKNRLNKVEPLLVPTIPKASNNMTSRALFYQRKLYDVLSFASPKFSSNKPLDFWYEKSYYGRSDVDSRAIHISETKLKQIPLNTSEPFYAVNFVSDAFVDFVQEMNYLSGRGVIPAKSTFRNLDLTSAWTSIHSLYHFSMDILYVSFKTYVSVNNLDKEIIDFSSFMKVFVRFIDAKMPDISLTRSKFILTNSVTPSISGLVLELSEQSKSEDRPKISTYISDPAFPLYKDTAMKYGFYIDKHAPWRMVADLGSPRLEPYMVRYGVNKDTVIDKYYYKSHYFDLSSLKKYVIEFYNSYVAKFPTVVKPKFVVDRNGKPTINTETIQRVVEEETQIDLKYSNEYWLRLYTFIRAREENKNWDQSFFEIVVRNSKYYLFAKGPNVAYDYIDRKCKIPSASGKKERNFHFFDNTVIS